MTDECLLREVWETLLFRGWEKLIPHLHLHDCVTQWIHCGLDIQVTPNVIDSRPTGLIPDKSMLRLFLLIVHLFIQPLITFNAFFKDAHCKQVVVNVVVPGDGEQDGQRLHKIIPRPLQEIVCQHASAAGRNAAGLGEGANLWHHGANRGLRWVVRFPTFKIYPEKHWDMLNTIRAFPKPSREQERTWGWRGSIYLSYLRSRWSCFLTCSPQLPRLQPTPSCCCKM